MSDAIERIADFLPEPDRERFLRVVARLREVPEDDEYLLVLEAIGFTSLILREIPDKVSDVLASSSPAEAGSPESTEFLLRRIKEEIPEAVNLPSLPDLRKLFHDLGTSIACLREEIRSLSAKIPAGSVAPSRRRKGSNLFATIAFSVVVFACVAAAGFYLHGRFNGDGQPDQDAGWTHEPFDPPIE